MGDSQYPSSDGSRSAGASYPGSPLQATAGPNQPRHFPEANQKGNGQPPRRAMTLDGWEQHTGQKAQPRRLPSSGGLTARDSRLPDRPPVLPVKRLTGLVAPELKPVTSGIFSNQFAPIRVSRTSTSLADELNRRRAKTEGLTTAPPPTSSSSQQKREFQPAPKSTTYCVFITNKDFSEELVQLVTKALLPVRGVVSVVVNEWAHQGKRKAYGVITARVVFDGGFQSIVNNVLRNNGVECFVLREDALKRYENLIDVSKQDTPSERSKAKNDERDKCADSVCSLEMEDKQRSPCSPKEALQAAERAAALIQEEKEITQKDAPWIDFSNMTDRNLPWVGHLPEPSADTRQERECPTAAEAETSPAETSPVVVTSPAAVAKAETSLAETPPAAETSAVETSPAVVAKAEASPAETIPAAETSALESSPAVVAKAEITPAESSQAGETSATTISSAEVPVISSPAQHEEAAAPESFEPSAASQRVSSPVESENVKSNIRRVVTPETVAPSPAASPMADEQFSASLHAPRHDRSASSSPVEGESSVDGVKKANILRIITPETVAPSPATSPMGDECTLPPTPYDRSATSSPSKSPMMRKLASEAAHEKAPLMVDTLPLDPVLGCTGYAFASVKDDCQGISKKEVAGEQGPIDEFVSEEASNTDLLADWVRDADREKFNSDAEDGYMDDVADGKVEEAVLVSFFSQSATTFGFDRASKLSKKYRGTMVPL